jgi:hypothetical protein
MPNPVPYDFAAADRLSQQLAQLAAKLDWLAWLRRTQRHSMLGAPNSDNWMGAKRHRFEHDFDRQQAALTGLAGTARTIKARVDGATADAHAARQKTHH